MEHALLTGCLTDRRSQSTYEARREKGTGIPAEKGGPIASAYEAVIAKSHQNTGFLQKRKYQNMGICFGKLVDGDPGVSMQAAAFTS